MLIHFELRSNLPPHSLLATARKDQTRVLQDLLLQTTRYERGNAGDEGKKEAVVHRLESIGEPRVATQVSLEDGSSDQQAEGVEGRRDQEQQKILDDPSSADSLPLAARQSPALPSSIARDGPETLAAQEDLSSHKSSEESLDESLDESLEESLDESHSSVRRQHPADQEEEKQAVAAEEQLDVAGKDNDGEERKPQEQELDNPEGGRRRSRSPVGNGIPRNPNLSEVDDWTSTRIVRPPTFFEMAISTSHLLRESVRLFRFSDVYPPFGRSFAGGKFSVDDFTAHFKTFLVEAVTNGTGEWVEGVVEDVGLNGEERENLLFEVRWHASRVFLQLRRDAASVEVVELWEKIGMGI